MKFNSIFSANTNKSLVTVLAAGALAIVSVVTTVAADGPIFNIFPIAYDGSQNTDYPLIDVRNVTKLEGWSVSQADHDAGVSADPGDVVEFLVYYHNGAADTPDNVAKNVIIKSTVPSSSGTQFNIGASISWSSIISSAVQTTNSASKGGDVTVKISGGVNQNLTLQPGTTIWLPNRGTSQQIMSDTIIGSGINLGDINGCWNFSGFVKFRVKVTQNQAVLSMTMNKQVKNVTDNTTFDDTSVNADPGETVEFKLVAKNTSDVTLNHFMVTDSLPSKLTFTPGTLITSQTALSGNLFNGGLDMGAVGIGQTITINFQAQVAGASQFSTGNTTLVNTGTASSPVPQFISSVSDTASVIVSVSAPQVCTIRVRAVYSGLVWSGVLNYSISGPTSISDSVVPKDFTNVSTGTYTPSYISGGPANTNFTGVTPTSGLCSSGGTLTFTYAFDQINTYSLTIDKQVRNITTGGAFSDSITASPSQTVEFKIVIKNTGNTTAINVSARDILPNLLTYVSQTLTLDGVSDCSGCFFSTQGISLGDMAVNQSRTILFQADIAGQNSFTVGTTPLTNTGYVKSNNVNEISDTARVDVVKTAAVKENGSGGTRPQ